MWRWRYYEKLRKQQKTNNNGILFVIPSNDGEAHEIKKMLQENNQHFLVTNQPWGASWQGLENEIKDTINNFDGQVYGVELQGETLCKTCSNIDHHKYENDDHSNKNLQY